MKNIYIIGRAIGFSRSQHLIKYLLDHQYNVYYNSFNINVFRDTKGLKRIIRLVLRLIEEFFKFFFKLYHIAISDIVILPAMCNNFQIELLIASFFNKKIVCDYYISYYDTHVLDRKTYSIDSRQAKKMMRYDINCLRKSNIVLFLNSTEADRYMNLANMKFVENKKIIVPLVIEENIKCNLPYINSANRENKTFNICWWGTYIPLHGLDNILQACKILSSVYEQNFRLYIFGNDDKKAQPFEKIIKELKISDKVSINNDLTFSNGKLQEFLKDNCDLALGNFGNSGKSKSVLGNKIIEGVSMKVPILTGESIAPFEFFSKDEIFFTKNNPSDIANAIVDIVRTDKMEILNRVDNSYKVYLEHFSPKAFENKLNNLFEKI